MKLVVAARRLLALAARRRARRGHDDFGDMGTAFGLDASTTLDAERLHGSDSAAAVAARSARLADRLHRRSSF